MNLLNCLRSRLPVIDWCLIMLEWLEHGVFDWRLLVLDWLEASFLIAGFIYLGAIFAAAYFTGGQAQ